MRDAFRVRYDLNDKKEEETTVNGTEGANFAGLVASMSHERTVQSPLPRTRSGKLDIPPSSREEVSRHACDKVQFRETVYKP